LGISRNNGLRGGGEFEVVGQVDNTDLADGHLHVGEILPSGEMDARPARHLLRSVFPLPFHILCSHCAFGVLERLTGAPVGSNVDGLNLLSRLDGGPEPSVEAAAIAAVPAGRSGA
tara:strand:- start:645 stop:992 length:348 start_codon:yes stop_codon:yes gene_type:complete